MAVPNFQTFLIPILRVASDGDLHTPKDFETATADMLQLNEDDRQQLLPSGAMTVLRDRVGWAYHHLYTARLLERPSRGKYRMTLRGQECLRDMPQGIDRNYLRRYPEYLSAVNTAQSPEPTAAAMPQSTPTETATPIAIMQAGFEELTSKLAQELLATIIEQSPAFFERLVLQLLVRMSYGGSMKDVRVVGRSGDGGIDGVINEDRLGLERIYIQAKRWKRGNNVGTPQIRDFIGALAGQASDGVHKGVFITTSEFQQGVHEYLLRVPNKVVLLDGKRLAELCIEFNIGVTTTDSFTIKEIDPLFFGEQV